MSDKSSSDIESQNSSDEGDEPRKMVSSWGNLAGMFKMIAYIISGSCLLFYICWLNGEAVDALFEPWRENCGPF